MAWRIDGPQGNEAAKVKYDIVPYTRGVGLDLGCGPHKAFPHFIGVDNGKDAELFGIQCTPDVKVDTCERLDAFETGACDFVFSSHLLEHIVDYPSALKEWWRVIKFGGHLILYLPDEDEYPRVGEPGANPDHQWNVNYCRVIDAMMAVGAWDLRVFEKRNLRDEYSLLFVFRKTAAGHTFSFRDPKPTKTACIVRYGGYGDMLQAASLFPELHRQGYHITVMTTPKGREVLENDPHIDDWFIQDNDQVPNRELPDFWSVWAPKFTKFVNLSESIEGTLLAMPGRANHAWPDAVRRRRMNINYLEWTAELAEIPYRPGGKFYPNEEEQVWVGDYLDQARKSGAFTLLWVLSGSSIHKFYPHQDEVIAQILLNMPEALLILVGDEACKILEAGWEEEPRIRRESGHLSIRQTLTLAQAVDCVVGPETGVLNAVAFERTVGKVILLSHSTKDNLTKHWKNALTISPPATVGCYPCHRLHYDSTFCPTDKDTGAAVCQMAIPAEWVHKAVSQHYHAWLAWRGQSIA